MSGDAADTGAPAAEGGPPQGLQPGGTGENGEIVGGPRTPQQMMAQKRMQQTQAQVDSVVDIMRANVVKVLERDEKLASLDERADALQQGAAQFEQQAGALKNKMWWKNMKMMIIMGVIGLVVVVIIAGPYLTGGKTGAEAPAGASIEAGPNAVGAVGPPAGSVGPGAVSPGANQTPQSSSSSTNQQLNRLQQQ